MHVDKTRSLIVGNAHAIKTKGVHYLLGKGAFKNNVLIMSYVLIVICNVKLSISVNMMRDKCNFVEKCFT